MKIEATEDLGILLSEVYTGVGIQTDMGEFQVVERDNGLWISYKGEMFCQYDMNGLRFGEDLD